MGNLAGVHRPSIDDLEILQFLQEHERELVAMGECFIQESKACGPVVQKGRTGHHIRGITGELASNNEMFFLQMPSSTALSDRASLLMLMGTAPPSGSGRCRLLYLSSPFSLLISI